MPYQPQYRNQPAGEATYSALSHQPPPPAQTYAIHLVKAQDPAYIPHDFDIWPIYHAAIIDCLRHHPDALQAACEAVKQTGLQHRGLQNRDHPPQ